MMFIHQIILNRLGKITRPCNIGHLDIYLLWGQSLGHTVSLSENMALMRQIVLEIQDKMTGPLNIGHTDLHLFWGQTSGHTDPYIHISNSLKDVTQNNWTMEYRSQWPIFILRSNLGSYWLIIPNNDVHTSNSLPDIRQSHWTMKYRSQWPTLILRSNIGSYWFILPMYGVHTSNSLQGIMQNHWTVKYRSCWPSLHDPQVHVTRLSHVWPTICLSCFHKRKSRKTLFKGVLDFDL